jgi:hypothetical protein
MTRSTTLSLTGLHGLERDRGAWRMPVRSAVCHESVSKHVQHVVVLLWAGAGGRTQCRNDLPPCTVVDM